MAHESRRDRRNPESWLAGGLFLGLFVYVWKGVGPHLLYHGFGIFTAYPVFSLEGRFLRTTATTPGGIVGALAALLAQSYSRAWLGALVIVGVLAVVFAGTLHLLRSERARWLRDLAWVPPLLALVVYNRYENPLPVLVALGLAIWAAILYGLLPVKRLPVRAGVFLAVFSVLYYLAGAAAFVFAAIVCLSEVLFERNVAGAIVSLVLAVGGAFLLGRSVFGLEPQAIYIVGTAWDRAGDLGFSAPARLLVLVLYAFVPALMLLMPLSGIVQKLGARLRLGRPRVGLVLRMLAVVAAGGLCLLLTRTHIRYERMLNYRARQRQWDQVIALAHRMRGRHAFTRSGVFDINRALAHQGRLGDELCAYPQTETKTLFLSFDNMFGRLQYSKQLELYLDLGCLNAAEKNAYELLENEGPTPYVLEAMVRVHLAKGQYESARIAFAALKKHVGCRAYARRWQDVMADPARAQTDALLQGWRRVASTRDRAVLGISFEPTLRGLLQSTPEHRLAYEYLMACYLLRHQRAAMIGGLHLLKPLGYERLPRHYAEALLVHALETRTPVATYAQGWTIELDLQQAFREIRSVVTSAHGNDQAVFDALKPKYGDTYAFYSLFNVCGVE